MNNNGPLVSVFGDSISTYEGYIIPGYSCYYNRPSYLSGKADWTFPNTMGGDSLDMFNDAIRTAAGKRGCRVADLASCGTYETLDGTHPTRTGHNQIAQA